MHDKNTADICTGNGIEPPEQLIYHHTPEDILTETEHNGRQPLILNNENVESLENVNMNLQNIITNPTASNRLLNPTIEDVESDPRLITYLNSETGETVYASRKKLKGRPKKYAINRYQIKKARNQNQSYIDSSGCKRHSKPVNFNHKCPCAKKCYIIIDNAAKEMFYDNFHSAGSYEGRSSVIIANCQRVSVKLNKKQNSTTQRKRYTYKYSIFGTPVCKEFFLKLLSINSKRVQNAFGKLHSKMKLKDYRGKKVGGQLAIKQAVKAVVISYINKLPRYTSHYCRAKNELNEYLAPGVTFLETYRQYKTEIMALKKRPVSFPTYRRIMKLHFNIKSKILKKDSCNTCDKFAKKIAVKLPAKHHSSY